MITRCSKWKMEVPEYRRATVPSVWIEGILAKVLSLPSSEGHIKANLKAYQTLLEAVEAGGDAANRTAATVDCGVSPEDDCLGIACRSCSDFALRCCAYFSHITATLRPPC